MKKIVTVVVGTHSYLPPMQAAFRRIHSAIQHGMAPSDEHLLICVTDLKSRDQVDAMTGAFEQKQIIGADVTEGGEHYKTERQILIATLQSIGFEAARRASCDLLWSVEADVLVPYNALLVSKQMLEFDSGYYDVAFVTYPSQGGGSFLGGHGEPHHPIAEDWTPEERKIGEWLRKAMAENEKRLSDESIDAETRKKELDRAHRIHDRIKKYPPKGNVFELNATRWRRRGWLDNAWPGIGRGAVIPTDWTGLGCTLMSKRAAELAHFDGYDGGGTQDLFLNWHRWHPAGLRFCCITHTICDHVVRDEKAKNGFTTLKAYHEQTGETRGHLRYRKTEFNTFENIPK
jgi:hypothetical protein